MLTAFCWANSGLHKTYEVFSLCNLHATCGCTPLCQRIIIIEACVKWGEILNLDWIDKISGK